jgi:biopolymer transport protein ExbD
MRFRRNVKVVRGQLEVAPFAAVFFLLLIFVLLTGLLYTPGIPLQVAAGEAERIELVIEGENRILYRGRVFTLDGALQFLRDANPAGTKLLLSVTKASPEGEQALKEFRDLARELHWDFVAPGSGVVLPESAFWHGTSNRTISVAVNLGGQFFYRNQLVERNHLLRILQEESRRTEDPLAMIVLADRSVENRVLAELVRMAQQSNIREVLLATRPRPFDSPGKR